MDKEKDKEMSLLQKLSKIQIGLNVPKTQYNNFGKYSYRNAEDILVAMKPFLKEYDLTLNLTDELVLIGDRYYIRAKATLSDLNNEHVYSYGYAREPKEKKGMDESQITGSTSSYARKYALSGLLAIDDTKDADFLNNGNEEKQASRTNLRSKEKQTTRTNSGSKEKQTTIQNDDRLYITNLWKQLETYAPDNAMHIMNTVVKDLGYKEPKQIKKTDSDRVDEIINSLLDQMNFENYEMER